MINLEWMNQLILLMFVAAPIQVFTELKVRIPMGRHITKEWGPSLPFKAGWILMESPVVVVFVVVYFAGTNASNIVSVVFLLMWLSHYVDRAFLFQFRMRTSNTRIFLLVVVSAFAYNLVNAYITAAWLGHFGQYTSDWLRDPRFIFGTIVFYTGYYINRRADVILARLRKPGDSNYHIPKGWLFTHISSPNYAGEILMWSGWACATWSLAGLQFAVFSTCNLGARAINNHRWYKDKFPEYPAERKALIPSLL